MQGVYRHRSAATATEMSFAVFVPAHPPEVRLPILCFLSGLTCTHANATDTSPRGEGVDDDQSFDLRQDAGFYVDAVQPPWAPDFSMWSHVTEEHPQFVAREFPADMALQGITGHSMGGHSELVVAPRHPARFCPVSAFAPIVAPSWVPWGHKAFEAYLGVDRDLWSADDAVALVEDGCRLPDLLIDQGSADQFLDDQLRPELLRIAYQNAGVSLTLRLQPGYDHGYGFVSTFMADHVRWHAKRLRS